MPTSLEKKTTAAYAALGGKNPTAFPWASVLDIIMKLLGGCTTPKAAQRWARRHEQAAIEAVEADMKEHKLFKTTLDRSAAAQAAVQTFIGATGAQLREVNIDG